jgi:hypothetical protein
MATDELPRSGWHDALETISGQHANEDVTIEVLDLDFGDQNEVERLPFAYLEYDPHDDEVNVGVGGAGGRYPVVLRHGVEHPATIAVATSPENHTTIEVVNGEGTVTLVTFHPRAVLPA